MSSTTEGSAALLRSRKFVLLLLSSIGSYCGHMTLLPIVPLWAAANGAGGFVGGGATGIYMAVTVFTQFVSPWLLRRYGYRPVLAAGNVLLGVPALLFPLADNTVSLFILAALRGIGFGLLTVAGSAMLAAVLPANQLGRGSGLYGVSVGLPQLVTIPLGVWSVTHWGYLPVFFFAGFLPLLGCIPLFQLPRLRATKASSSVTKRAHPLKQLLALGLLMLVTATVSGAVLTFLPLALPAASAVPVGLFLLSVSMLGGRWIAGVLQDRSHSVGWALISGIILAMVGATIIAISIYCTAALLATIGCVLIGGGFGVVQTDTMVLMFRRVEPAGYGFASAMWNAGYDAGTGLGAILIGGLTAVTGYAWAFAITAALALTFLPVAIGVTRRRPMSATND